MWESLWSYWYIVLCLKDNMLDGGCLTMVYGVGCYTEFRRGVGETMPSALRILFVFQWHLWCRVKSWRRPWRPASRPWRRWVSLFCTCAVWYLLHIDCESVAEPKLFVSLRLLLWIWKMVPVSPTACRCLLTQLLTEKVEFSWFLKEYRF